MLPQDQALLGEFFPNQHTYEAAGRVTLALGQTLGAIGAELESGAFVTVTLTSTQPYSGALLCPAPSSAGSWQTCSGGASAMGFGTGPFVLLPGVYTMQAVEPP